MKPIISGLLLLLLMTSYGCSAQSRLESGREEVSVSETLNYYLYYPPEYDQEPAQDFPLLLFLHGGGESGGSLEMIQKNGPPKLLAEGKEFPFLILSRMVLRFNTAPWSHYKMGSLWQTASQD